MAAPVSAAVLSVSRVLRSCSTSSGRERLHGGKGDRLGAVEDRLDQIRSRVRRVELPVHAAVWWPEDDPDSMVIPTLVTIATLDFAFVMLAESALSFLGIGIQPPEITWGPMVTQGKRSSPTWLAFWPGLAIILTTLPLNLLSNWLRIALDPAQRWRLEIAPKGGSMTGHLLEVRNLSVRFPGASMPGIASSLILGRYGMAPGTHAGARNLFKWPANGGHR